MKSQTTNSLKFHNMKRKFAIAVPARRIALAVLLAKGVLCLAPQTPAQAQAKPQTKNVSSSVQSTEYLIGADDVLDIAVGNYDYLNRTVTVRPDGKISMPRAGEVMAAGQSANALAKTIQSKLKVVRAKVTVTVKEVHSRRASILGAVKTGGIYDLKPGWRVMDLVALAGGLSTKPTRVSGKIIRAGAVLPFSVVQAVGRPAGQANLLLQPNDLIIMEEQYIEKQIHVIGQVTTPGAYDLEEGLNIVSLIAQAGGVMPTAALNKAHILRGTRQIAFDLEPVLVNGETDARVSSFKFRPGDTLVIPENQLRFGVMGQVARPDYFSLPSKATEATVLKSLAKAGGHLADGDLRKATITRIVDGQVTTIPIDIAAMLAGEMPDAISLQANDILNIPKIYNQIHVTGQVGKPGSYQLSERPSDATVQNALAVAGGALEDGDLRNATISRIEDGRATSIRVDIRALQAGETTEGALLQPGDVLHIPEAYMQVNVVGEVARPGAVRYKEGLGLISLVSEVGSPKPGASLKNSYLLRGEKQIDLDLHGVLVEGTPNPFVTGFKVQPGDILVIPQNKLRFGVMGHVVKAGYYPYPEKKDDASVVKALTNAGGAFTGGNGANLKDARILRLVNGKVTQIPVNLDELLRNGQTSQNVVLQPEDVLYVPERNAKRNFLQFLSPLMFLSGIF